MTNQEAHSARYGIENVPQEAQIFIAEMQEMVEAHLSKLRLDPKVRKEHQFFFRGTLKNRRETYALHIPMRLTDFEEYPLTAAMNALASFIGAAYFGLVLHDSKTNDTESNRASSPVMMLAYIEGAWYYNLIQTQNNSPIPTIGTWEKDEERAHTLPEAFQNFMAKMAKSLSARASANQTKADMTLAYLKSHYDVKLATAAPQSLATNHAIN